MRSNGKYREILNTITGLLEMSNCPATREEALAEDVAIYYPPRPCPTCGERTTYFTRTRKPACCALRKAQKAYDHAVAAREPLGLTEARLRSLDYFWVPTPNPLCGHPGKITLSGQCVFCADLRKARKTR